LADRRLGLGRAQARDVAVEPFEHLKLAELRQDRLHGRVKVKTALFDELQRASRGERLGHRSDAEHRVPAGVARCHVAKDAVTVNDDR
jgi:hypothetical protein